MLNVGKSYTMHGCYGYKSAPRNKHSMFLESSFMTSWSWHFSHLKNMRPSYWIIPASSSENLAKYLEAPARQPLDFSLHKVHGHTNKIETPHPFQPHFSLAGYPLQGPRCVVCVNLSALKTCKKTGDVFLLPNYAGNITN